MIKRSLLAILVGVGLTSCLKDPVESAITQLNNEQAKIIEGYLTANNITAKKEVLSNVNGDIFPIYSIVETKGDSTTQYTKHEAIWVAYTIRAFSNNAVIETKSATDSVLIYPGNYSSKIQGLAVCAATGFIHKGGKGRFYVPATLGWYNTQPPVGGVETNSILVLDVEVIDRLSEEQQIQFYIKKNKLKVTQTTSSGLILAKTTVTTDSLVTTTATAKFSGHYVNGYEFQKEATSANMVLSTYIPGFSEALKLMRKGEKAVAILPSKIAYGEDGGGRMPIFMPLVFNLEVLDNK